MELDIAGVRTTLASLPHLLIGGSSGSGKSTALHGLILQLVGSVELVLIDPKRVELALWRPAACRVAVEIEEISTLLAEVVEAMGTRFQAMEKAGVRHIDGLGIYAPILVVIDELAAITCQKNNREPIDSLNTLAQQGRAAGVHLILATQHPTVQCVPSLLKANCARVALRCATRVASRVILDEPGAERLREPGEALVRVGASLTRGAFPYFTDEQLEGVVAKCEKSAAVKRGESPKTGPRPRERRQRPQYWRRSIGWSLYVWSYLRGRFLRLLAIAFVLWLIWQK